VDTLAPFIVERAEQKAGFDRLEKDPTTTRVTSGRKARPLSAAVVAINHQFPPRDNAKPTFRAPA
jgi:hypothetical protein